MMGNPGMGFGGDMGMMGGGMPNQPMFDGGMGMGMGMDPNMGMGMGMGPGMGMGMGPGMGMGMDPNMGMGGGMGMGMDPMGMGMGMGMGMDPNMGMGMGMGPGFFPSPYMDPGMMGGMPDPNPLPPLKEKRDNKAARLKELKLMEALDRQSAMLEAITENYKKQKENRLKEEKRRLKQKLKKLESLKTLKEIQHYHSQVANEVLNYNNQTIFNHINAMAQVEHQPTFIGIADMRGMNGGMMPMPEEGDEVEDQDVRPGSLRSSRLASLNQSGQNFGMSQPPPFGMGMNPMMGGPMMGGPTMGSPMNPMMKGMNPMMGGGPINPMMGGGPMNPMMGGMNPMMGGGMNPMMNPMMLSMLKGDKNKKSGSFLPPINMKNNSGFGKQTKSKTKRDEPVDEEEDDEKGDEFDNKNIGHLVDEIMAKKKAEKKTKTVQPKEKAKQRPK